MLGTRARPAPTPEPSALRTRYAPDTRVLTVEGDVSYCDVDTVARMLRCLAGDGGGVVDLSGVTYLPAAAVGVLEHAVARSAPSRAPIQLRAARGSVAHAVLRSLDVAHDDRPATDGSC